MLSRSESLDEVQLLVGGKLHSRWDSYEVDSHLLTPADAWRVTLATESARIPAAIKAGANVEVRVGGERVMVGRIGNVRTRTNKAERSLVIGGRDLAGQLLDCSAPIMSAQMLTLEEVVKRIVNPLGITKVRIDAKNAMTAEKINIEPGDRAWDALQNAAEANGLWPWFEPDGTLVVGGPDYNKPPVATLVMRIGAEESKKNNVLSFSLEDNIDECFSEVTVLSQTHGGGDNKTADNKLSATYKDPSVGFYRPRIVIDHEADNQKFAHERARKMVMDSRLKRWTLVAEVPYHRIIAPGTANNGLLWQPGQRVNVIDETNNLEMTCFLIGRQFRGGRNEKPTTVLTLKEDGVWIVAAHPHKKNSRRDRDGNVREIDISKSPEAGKTI